MIDKKIGDKPIHIIRSKRSVGYLRRIETAQAEAALNIKVKK